MTTCIECDETIYTWNYKHQKVEYKKPKKVISVVCGKCVQRRQAANRSTPKMEKLEKQKQLKLKAKAMEFGELVDSLYGDLGDRSVSIQDDPGQ